MSARAVDYTILRPDGTPWPGARVLFEITPGSFSSTAQYPRSTISSVAGADGTGSVTLWANDDEAESATEIKCTMLGETFYFLVPAGVGSINLSTCRQAYAGPSQPGYTILLGVITPIVDDALADMQALLDQAEAAVENAEEAVSDAEEATDDANAAIVTLNAIGTCFTFTADGLPQAGEPIFWYRVQAEVLKFDAGMPNCSIEAQDAATATAVLSIRKNGLQFATATFSAAGTVAVVTSGAAAQLVDGDLLEVIAPASPDATLAFISGTFSYHR